MAVYIAMLRAVNVSGRNRIDMSKLRTLCTDLGLVDPVTYIQSGNLVFGAETDDPPVLAGRLEHGISERFGLDVTVLVRTRPELAGVVEENPFTGPPDSVPPYVVYLHAAPDPDLVEHLSVPHSGADRFHLAGREIYLECPGGYGNTKLNNGLFERKLAVRATTRNWKTTLQLLDLAAGR